MVDTNDPRKDSLFSLLLKGDQALELAFVARQMIERFHRAPGHQRHVINPCGEHWVPTPQLFPRER